MSVYEQQQQQVLYNEVTFKSVPSRPDEESDKVDIGVLLLGYHHFVVHPYYRRPVKIKRYLLLQFIRTQFVSDATPTTAMCFFI